MGVVILLLGAGWMIRILISTNRRSDLRGIMAVIGEALLLIAGGEPSGRRR